MFTSKKDYLSAKIIDHRAMSENVRRMWLEAPTISTMAVPGQFVNIYVANRAKILPRPISICEIDRERGRISLVYRVGGEDTGTLEISRLRPGERLNILGPLGNGFPITNKSAMLVGGGIGIPPMYALSREIYEIFGQKSLCVLGYKGEGGVMYRDFQKMNNVFVSTEDGSIGTKGTVIDAIEAFDLEAEIIYACGPMPMLSEIKKLAIKRDVKAYVSLDSRMGCGVGVCLSCTVDREMPDPISGQDRVRICTEGPVFEVREVNI